MKNLSKNAVVILFGMIAIAASFFALEQWLRAERLEQVFTVDYGYIRNYVNATDKKAFLDNYIASRYESKTVELSKAKADANCDGLYRMLRDYLAITYGGYLGGELLEMGTDEASGLTLEIVKNNPAPNLLNDEGFGEILGYIGSEGC